jgi:hypothetical protein
MVTGLCSLLMSFCKQELDAFRAFVSIAEVVILVWRRSPQATALAAEVENTIERLLASPRLPHDGALAPPLIAATDVLSSRPTLRATVGLPAKSRPVPIRQLLERGGRSFQPALRCRALFSRRVAASVAIPIPPGAWRVHC